MTTNKLTQPAAEADDDFDVPGWLYRSEAFAEDLLPGDAPPRRTLRERLPASLYVATLALAALALPATLLPA